jgi:hypothetical protein
MKINSIKIKLDALDEQQLYQLRVQQLESLGCTTSDAQGVADAELENGSLNEALINESSHSRNSSSFNLTNIDKITGIMEYSQFGALAQMFVMDAVSKFANLVANTPIEELESMRNGLISPEGWRGVAVEIAEKLRS